MISIWHKSKLENTYAPRKQTGLTNIWQMALVILLIFPATGFAGKNKTCMKNTNDFLRKISMNQFDGMNVFFAEDLLGKSSHIKSSVDALKAIYGNIISWDNSETLAVPGMPNERRVNIDIQFQKAKLLLMLIYNEKNKINAVRFLGDANIKSDIPSQRKHLVKLFFPAKGKWAVVSGGFTIRQTHHILSGSQRYAYDLIKLDDKDYSYRGSRNNYKSYYAYSSPVFAPADGKVVIVVDGVPDMKMGSHNEFFFGGGNAVIIEHGKNEYSYFAHLLKNSIVVKEGDLVRRGDFIAKVGNSSSHDVPHLHYSLMDSLEPNTAKGIPIIFENIKIGKATTNEYYLMFGDVVESNATSAE